MTIELQREFVAGSEPLTRAAGRRHGLGDDRIAPARQGLLYRRGDRSPALGSDLA